MTDWIEPEEVPENATPFVDEGDWNILVNNDKNTNERLSVLEMYYTAGAVPTGGVILWYGNLASLPEGWQVCDGTNNLPDLRGRFVIGAEADEDLGDIGGNESHVHDGGVTSTASTHSHSGTPGISGSADTKNATLGGIIVAANGHAHYPYMSISAAGAHNHDVGPGGSSSNIPPYRKLYWIGKVTAI